MSAASFDPLVTLPASAARRRGGLSLRWRLALLVLASIVPMLAFNIGHEYLNYRDDVASAGEQRLALARSMSLLLDAALQERIVSLETLATSRALQAGDLKRFRAQAEAVVAEQFPDGNILLLKKDGEQAMNTSVPEGAPIPARPNVESTQQVFATGRPAVSNVFHGVVRDRPVVAIDVPVKGLDGSVIYVLSLSPDLEAFADAIRHLHPPASWKITVIDRRGLIVARVPGGEQFVGHPVAAGFEKIQAEQEGVAASTSLDGVPVLATFSHAKQFGWAVAIGEPQAELIAPIVAAARRTLAAGGILLAIALALALYAARGIAGPIRTLRRLAAATDRDPERDLVPTGLPETDEVARMLLAAKRVRRSGLQALERFRVLVAGVKDYAIVMLDPQGRIVTWNEGAQQLKGYTEAEIVGRSMETFYAPEDIAAGTPARLLAEAAQGRCEDKGWRVRKDGTRFFADVVITAMRDETGELVGFAKITRDITELNASEQALRTSERRFQDIAEAGGDWIWETDRDHRFTLLLGRTDLVDIRSQSLIGQTRWESISADAENDELWAGHRADLDARKTFRHFHYETHPPTGAGMFISASGKPVFAENGNFLGYRGTATDETVTVEARHRAEVAEAQLRDAVDSIAGGFLITDTADRIVLFNQQISAFYPDCATTLKIGAPYRDFLHERIRRGYYPQAAGREDAWFAEAMARHQEGSNAAEIRLPNGRWLLLAERRMSDGEVAGVSPDVTAIKNALQALSASDERFRLVVESVPNAIVMIKADGAIDMVNAQAERIFGYSRAELLGRPIETLLPERDRDHHPGLRTAFFAAPEARPMGAGRQLYALRKDGSEFPVEIDVSPIEIEGASMVLSSVVDISERLQSEQERRRGEENLRISEDRFRSIYSAVSEGIFIFSRQDGVFTEVNEAGCVMFGYTVGELIGGTIEMLSSGVPPYTQAEAIKFHEKAAATGRPQRFEWHCKRKGGRLFWTEISIRVASISGQDVVIATVRDVTEQRAVEQQLRQAQKMEAIGNLTGGMAHDFNNLLGIIVGNLALAQERIGNDPELREITGEALDAAWRGADLTRRLLAFARRQPLRPAHIDMNELITDTVRLMRRLLGEAIEISLNLGDAVWPVLVDPAQLEASLANLATNARDAMPKGGRLIIATGNRHLDAEYVAANPDATEGDFAMIEVSDSGNGMSPDTVSQIFEPFFTTKEPGKGTGLGLSMVFGFLRQSGGNVSVYSEPGVGTTFRLYLPRALADGARVEASEPAALARGTGEIVLVVEDNPAMRRVSLRQLRELGYRVLECDRAAAALEVLQREPVDLLFTDVIMPGGLDGIELAQMARERWPALKIVLTSGFPEAKIDGNGDLLGSLRLLSKPYRKEELAAVLRAALDA